MSVSFVYAEDYYADIGEHVFPIAKFRLLAERLVAEGLVARDQFVRPTLCSRDDLLLAHTPEYVDDLLACRRTERTCWSELPLSPAIVQAYVLGSGGTMVACARALDGGAAINLTGGFHHCFPDHAEGFCYVNDVAIAIREMQRLGRIQNACVVDCDLHQGNGTAVIFQRDPSVFTFSIHQERLYPFKQQSDLDIGLDDWTDDDAYVGRLADALPGVLDRHGPELVVYLAGADPFEGDALGSLALTKGGLRRRDELVLRECHARDIPVAAVLAGGYAFHTDDVVDIHFNTCKILCELWPDP